MGTTKSCKTAAIMGLLGPGRFLAAGLAVLGAAWALGRHGTMGGTEDEQ